MSKRGKTKRPREHCKRYLNERRRMKNKIFDLEKRLERLKETRKEDVINPNTKLPPKRRPIENIIKSCRIGRNREGFSKEDFKFRKPTHGKK